VLQPRSDNDPLLEFSSEPDAAPAPPAPQPDDTQPVAPPVVAADPPASHATADEVALLRVRIGRMEKSLEQALKDLRATRSEVATLVAAAKDIRPGPTFTPRERPLRTASAIAGIVIGVLVGVWIWSSLGTEPVAPQAPPVEISSAKPEPTPPAPIQSPVVTQPAIVQAAAIMPVNEAPPSHAAAPPAARAPGAERSERIINYVGTLSIDADPSGDVFIDRKPAGKTPMRAENLKAGSHLVWIERDGYRRFTRVVQVPADRVTRLVADLEPER
jgi:hypothetical protein